MPDAADDLIFDPVLDEEYAAYMDGDTPRLREATVLFLDALGTRQLSTGSGAQDHLERTQRALAQARSWGTLQEDLPQTARWFSDNLVFAIRTFPERDFDPSFGSHVISTAWVQLAMLMEGVPCRGGLEIGDFFASDRFVYGPALIAAYELESHVAIYPRVALGAGAVAQATSEVAAGENETYRAMLAVDTDGVVFVNYLGDIFADGDGPGLEGLTRHREFVLDRLSGEPGPRIGPKYEWMAAFHDWFVSENLSGDPADELCIDPDRNHGFARF